MKLITRDRPIVGCEDMKMDLNCLEQAPMTSSFNDGDTLQGAITID
jgi:hypothetical protein